MDLRGKVVFITGGARGIGAAVGAESARRGASVALAGLEPEVLAETAARIGPETMHVVCDVTDLDSVRAAVASAVERFGGIDVVLANAGSALSAPPRRAIRRRGCGRSTSTSTAPTGRSTRRCRTSLIEAATSASSARSPRSLRSPACPPTRRRRRERVAGPGGPPGGRLPRRRRRSDPPVLDRHRPRPRE